MSTRFKKGISLVCATGLCVCACAAAPLLSPALHALQGHLKLQKCALSGQSVRFSEQELDRALGTKTEFIRVEQLPALQEGMLMLEDVRVSEGQLIAREDYDRLTFVPTDETVETVSFAFSDASTDVRVSCVVNLLEEVNLAPQTQAQRFTTAESIAVCKFLKASDPERDAMTFRITNYPAHGRVELDETGYFRYTPTSGYTGEDFFEYAVCDCYGNQSESERVSFRVTKPATSFRFDDLSEHWAANAALRVAEKGLMTGVSEGDKILFEPNETVSRGDLLAMTLIAAGKEASIDFTARTAFADDASIPLNIKSYAEYARVNGIVKGQAAENGVAVFSGTSGITRAEAAVMIDRVLALPAAEEGALSAFSDGADTPEWAREAMARVTACGLLSGTGFGELRPNACVTRAEAAELICNISDHMESHEEVPKTKRTLWNLFGLLDK